MNIVIDPSIQNGRPHHRFHGHTGEVLGTQGKAYVIKLFDGKKEKHPLVASEHLRPFCPEKKSSKIWKTRTKKIHLVVEKSVKEPKEIEKSPMKKVEGEEKGDVIQSLVPVEKDVSDPVDGSTDEGKIEAVFEIIGDD